MPVEAQRLRRNPVRAATIVAVSLARRAGLASNASQPHGLRRDAIGCIERLGAAVIGQAAVKIGKPRTLGLRFAVP